MDNKGKNEKENPKRTLKCRDNETTIKIWKDVKAELTIFTAMLTFRDKRRVTFSEAIHRAINIAAPEIAKGKYVVFPQPTAKLESIEIQKEKIPVVEYRNPFKKN